MSSVNDGNITQEPGDGASFSFSGTSSQFLDGTGTPKDLSAAEMPSGIDAAKIADGSVSNAEYQTLSDISTGSTIQAQLDAKASSSALTSGLAGKSDTGHSHTLSALSGAVTDGQLPSASNASTIGAISTVANAALPKAGGTMTGSPILSAVPLRFTGSGSSAGGSVTQMWSDGSNINVNAVSGASLGIYANNILYGGWGATGAQWYGTQSLSGGAITCAWRDSAGNLWINAPSGAGVALSTNGVLTFGLGGGGGLALYSTQASLNGSVCQWFRDVSGNMVGNVQNGASFALCVNNVNQFDVRVNGLNLPVAHTPPANTALGLFRDAQATYLQGGGGCVVLAARLLSRANSTAYSLCLAPTGDVLRCLLQDSSSKRATALVDASGTVTFEAGSHADYVASSSPASGEVGVYISSGVLTIKPGSAGARSIAANVARAQA